MNRLHRILNLHAGEGLPSLLLFLYLTLVLTTFIIQKSVRDALFLAEFGAGALPYVYISVAVVTAVVVTIYVRFSSRLGQVPLICGTLALFMLNGIALWWMSGAHWPGFSIAYYLWANTSGVVLTAQVWTLATTILTGRQSRRLFPLICSGGVLGSTLGGLIASAAAKQLGTEHLILVPVVLIAACLILVQITARLYRDSPRDPAEQPEEVETNSVREVLRVTMNSRYLRLIATLLSLSAIVTMFVDFQFKTVIQQTFRDRDNMTAFFGSFYAYCGLLAFMLQLFAGSHIVRKYGLRLALLLLPMALLSGTAILLVYPSMMWTGLFLKGSDGILRGSIDRSTVEMLYVPVPDSLRVQVKAVIDMLIQRFSDALGGVILLVMTQVLGIGLYGIGVFNMGLLGVWIWTAWQTRREYARALRQVPPQEPHTPTVSTEAA
jgi:ATP:ADP antiporter, AAA family